MGTGVDMTDANYPVELCGALMGIFEGGASSLSDIVDGLNDSDIATPSHGAWTEEELRNELRRLGAAPEKTECGEIIDVKRSVIAAVNGSNEIPEQSYDEALQQLTDSGLRNHWYVVAASYEVLDEPVGFTRLGEKLVLWRDEAGAVHAVEDRCPHRGIALSIGEVYNGNLKCAYHGIQVNGDGVVVEVPAFPECSYAGEKLVREYPVFEHYQMIWAYFGDQAHLDPPPLELPVELTSPNWSGALHTADWEGHYQYVYDNIADPMHGSFLHGTTYMQSRGNKTDHMVIEDTGHGFEFFRKGQQETSFDWMEFIDTGSSKYMRAKIGFPPTGGPGGPLCIVFFTTPIDENNTRIFAYRFRQVSGWQADLYHFMYKTQFMAFMDSVLAQDKMALKAMPPWPPRENLYQHDVGLVRIRRIFQQQAESQARDLVGGDA
jgi:phenylpropionate dioxygenase-like ring-hydroxylating dioxygenase large terminal subunit